MKFLFCALLLLVSGSVYADNTTVSQVPNPRRDLVWVSDTAEMIDAADEAAINQEIESINSEYGVEIAVVTLYSVDAPTPKDFATELFNRWGIGQKGRDNGLLILMVQGERRLEMETGYGLEPVLTDGWLKSMQMAEMVPRFKEGRYGIGLRAGVKLSVERLRDYYASGETLGALDTTFDAPSEDVNPGDYLLWLILGGGGVGAAFGGSAWKKKRDRRCVQCKNEMQVLDEMAEDEHLTDGQELEESLGSILYDVFWCQACELSKVVSKDKWFSGYNRCPSCGLKTGNVMTSTMSIATTMSSGLERVSESCANCDHARTYTRVIPRVQQTSSSSGASSGGSSGGFSGGSSGGGGSGSSW